MARILNPSVTKEGLQENPGRASWELSVTQELNTLVDNNRSTIVDETATGQPSFQADAGTINIQLGDNSVWISTGRSTGVMWIRLNS